MGRKEDKRARLERLALLERQILAKRAASRGADWEIGVALAEIRDRGLYRESGHKSFRRYHQEVLGYDHDEAYALLRIAQFPQADAIECGPTRLKHAAAIYALTAEEEDPAKVGSDLFPVEEDGRIVRKLLKKCSTRQLKRLLARMRGEATAVVLPADLRRFVETVRTLMADHSDFTFDAVPAGADVRLDRKGVLLSNVWDYIAALTKALRALGYQPPGPALAAHTVPARRPAGAASTPARRPAPAARPSRTPPAPAPSRRPAVRSYTYVAARAPRAPARAPRCGAR